MSVARRQRTLCSVHVCGRLWILQRSRHSSRILAGSRGCGHHLCAARSGRDGPRANLAALRIDVPRRTTLEWRGVRVEMIEHVLAALAGLAVDNCEVWVDAAEMPGCDGSAKAFVEAIEAAGLSNKSRPCGKSRDGAGARRHGRELDRSPAAAAIDCRFRSNSITAAIRRLVGSDLRSMSSPIRFARNCRRAARSFRRKSRTRWWPKELACA